MLVRLAALASMKTCCTKCGAEILTRTADFTSGLCSPCYGLARAIAWRRSLWFIWICLVLPAFLIAFALWQVIHGRWAWLWAVGVLVLLLIGNFKRRTSTGPPPC